MKFHILTALEVALKTLSLSLHAQVALKTSDCKNVHF